MTKIEIMVHEMYVELMGDNGNIQNFWWVMPKGKKPGK